MTSVIRTAPGSRLGAVLVVLTMNSVSVSVAWSQQGDPEWPCIQRLVMEVSPAVMWPLPVAEEMHSLWRSDEQVRVLAEKLGDLDSYSEVEQKQVESFAAGIPAEDKEYRLSLLAVGVLDVTNAIRRHYIDGIKRYTRQQIAIADQIEDTLNQISLLEDADAGSADAQQDDLLATLKWHERVYDQRENAIRSLCDQPVDLEQTLSDVLRDIAQYLP